MSEGFTPLFFAIQNNHYNIILYIIHYCKSSKTDYENIPPIILAVTLKNNSMVQFLIQACDVDVNCPNIKGETPLYIACSIFLH